MNSDKVLYGSFDLYPSYTACILNSVKEIHFYVLCCKTLNYADIEKILLVKSTVLLIKRIREIIWSYRVMR